MPMSDQLTAGQMVTYKGMAVKLTSFVTNVAGNYYWWCTTLFTREPEPVMMAFAEHTAVGELHTRAKAKSS